jgi:putative transcription factor
MSKHFNQIYNDFEPVILRNKSKDTKLQAQRAGRTETKAKSASSQVIKMAKLANDHESTKVEKVSPTLQKLIQQTRLAKKWTQKDLANKVNMNVADIQKYENGTAIPKQDQILKLQRVLGTKLTGLNKSNKK